MKKEKIILLRSIYDKVKEIDFSTDSVKIKALKFIEILFSQYVNNHLVLSFEDYRHMSKEYWVKLIPGRSRHQLEIKRLLVENNILEEKTGLYKKDHRLKSYRFNQKLIYKEDINYTILEENIKQIQLDKTEVELYTINIINQLKVSEYTKEQLSEIIEKRIKENIKVITIEDIEEYEIIKITLNGKDYTYKIENALEKAKEENIDLICWKNESYHLSDLKTFINMKRIDLSISYEKQLLDIKENVNIRASVNDTNYRLDSNMTNLAFELWNFVSLDDENFVEIDISNSQFAIASNFIKVDDKFKELSINGKLYEYVANELNITRSEAKYLMMRFAFDKVYENKYTNLANLFPIFYNSVVEYKKENGYKAFAIYLQTLESDIMIKTVLNKLREMGYNVLSVHDSIRCKNSEYSEILQIIKDIFKEINFKCILKEKTNITEENINIEENKELIEYIKYVEENIINNEIKPYSNWFLGHSPNNKRYLKMWNKEKDKICLYLFNNKTNNITEEKIREAIKKQYI